MNAFSESHFHIGEVPWGEHLDIHFVPAAEGKPSRIEQSFDGGKADVYEAVTAVDPSAAQLGEYAGAFVSEEIEPVYRFAITDGKLTLTRLKSKPDALRPTEKDVFTGQIGTIRFTRDNQQRVSGFILDAGRIQGFQFTRRQEPTGAARAASAQ